eukprot:COSAG01_NODE_3066_length_6646_cov_3.861769_1_plen_1296_part_00
MLRELAAAMLDQGFGAQQHLKHVMAESVATARSERSARRLAAAPAAGISHRLQRQLAFSAPGVSTAYMTREHEEEGGREASGGGAAATMVQHRPRSPEFESESDDGEDDKAHFHKSPPAQAPAPPVLPGKVQLASRHTKIGGFAGVTVRSCPTGCLGCPEGSRAGQQPAAAETEGVADSIVAPSVPAQDTLEDEFEHEFENELADDSALLPLGIPGDDTDDITAAAAAPLAADVTACSCLWRKCPSADCRDREGSVLDEPAVPRELCMLRDPFIVREGEYVGYLAVRWKTHEVFAEPGLQLGWGDIPRTNRVEDLVNKKDRVNRNGVHYFNANVVKKARVAANKMARAEGLEEGECPLYIDMFRDGFNEDGRARCKSMDAQGQVRHYCSTEPFELQLTEDGELQSVRMLDAKIIEAERALRAEEMRQTEAVEEVMEGMIRQIEQAAPAFCPLCGKGSNAELGELLNFNLPGEGQPEIWKAHRHCVSWVQTMRRANPNRRDHRQKQQHGWVAQQYINDRKLITPAQALKACWHKRCTACGERGAHLMCHHSKCKRIYHLKCVNKETKVALCRKKTAHWDEDKKRYKLGYGPKDLNCDLHSLGRALLEFQPIYNAIESDSDEDCDEEPISWAFPNVRDRLLAKQSKSEDEVASGLSGGDASAVAVDEGEDSEDSSAELKRQAELRGQSADGTRVGDATSLAACKQQQKQHRKQKVPDGVILGPQPPADPTEPATINEATQTHTTNSALARFVVVKKTLVKVGMELNSAEIGVLPVGTELIALEVQDNRVRCSTGWASIVSSKGNTLLVAMPKRKRERPPSDSEDEDETPEQEKALPTCLHQGSRSACFDYEFDSDTESGFGVAHRRVHMLESASSIPADVSSCQPRGDETVAAAAAAAAAGSTPTASTPATSAEGGGGGGGGGEGGEREACEEGGGLKLLFQIYANQHRHTRLLQGQPDNQVSNHHNRHRPTEANLSRDGFLNLLNDALGLPPTIEVKQKWQQIFKSYVRQGDRDIKLSNFGQALDDAGTLVGEAHLSGHVFTTWQQQQDQQQQGGAQGTQLQPTHGRLQARAARNLRPPHTHDIPHDSTTGNDASTKRNRFDPEIYKAKLASRRRQDAQSNSTRSAYQQGNPRGYSAVNASRLRSRLHYCGPKHESGVYCRCCSENWWRKDGTVWQPSCCCTPDISHGDRCPHTSEGGINDHANTGVSWNVQGDKKGWHYHADMLKQEEVENFVWAKRKRAEDEARQAFGSQRRCEREKQQRVDEILSSSLPRALQPARNKQTERMAMDRHGKRMI